MTTPKHPTPHVATGALARELREFLAYKGIKPGEDVFFLAQSLSFLIHDTPIEVLSSYLHDNKNRFAIRKLKAVISMLDSVFKIC